MREQAFSAVLFSNSSSEHVAVTTDGLELAGDDTSVLMIRRALAFTCYQKLLRIPSLTATFMNLHTGKCCSAIDAGDKDLEEFDPVHIEHIVSWNCFSFPISSRDSHYLNYHDPEKVGQDRASLGLWIKASYMNHNCVPNTQRSFIGDVMIVRAGSDLKAGTELKHSYVDISKNFAERQTELQGYGFQCGCGMCSAWMNTVPDQRKKREDTVKYIRDLIINGGPTPLSELEIMLDDLEGTYGSLSDEEPRIELMPLLMAMITSCSDQGQSWNVFGLVARLSDILGFKALATPVSYEIKKWGYVDDIVVLALVALWKAQGSSGPKPCADVEKLAKVAYEMVVGESDSFEAAYGSLRTNFTHWAYPEKLEGYPSDSILRNLVHYTDLQKARNGHT